MASHKPKANGFVHPRSRKAHRIKHLEDREKKLTAKKRETLKKVQPLQKMLENFKQILERFPEKKTFSSEEILEFSENYFLEKFENSEKTKNFSKRIEKKSLFSRFQEISTDTLKNNFFSGEIDIPDLRDERNVENLKLWDGKEKSVTLVKLVSINELMKDLE